jgi:hypothetical protein
MPRSSRPRIIADRGARCKTSGGGVAAAETAKRGLKVPGGRGGLQPDAVEEGEAMDARTVRRWSGVTALWLLGAAFGCGAWYSRYGIANEKELHSFEAVPKLIEALEHGNCYDTLRAAEAIQRIGEQARSSFYALERALRRDDCNPRQRAAVARALGRLGRAGFAPLQQALRKEDIEMRRLAVIGLGATHHRRELAVELLAAKLDSRDPFDRRARPAAFAALAEQGPAARPAISRLVQQLGQLEWRWPAVDCLLAIGHPAPEALAALERLSRTVRDAEQRQRLRAAYRRLRGDEADAESPAVDRDPGSRSGS